MPSVKPRPTLEGRRPLLVMPAAATDGSSTGPSAAGTGAAGGGVVPTSAHAWREEVGKERVANLGEGGEVEEAASHNAVGGGDAAA